MLKVVSTLQIFYKMAYMKISLLVALSLLGGCALRSADRLGVVKMDNGEWFIGRREEMESSLSGLPVKELHVGRRMGRLSISGIAPYGLAFSDMIERIWIDDGVALSEFCLCTNYSLQHVRLPEDIGEIPAGLCSGCVKLTAIKIPETVRRIERQAFYYTGIEDVYIPDSVEFVGDEAFGDCRSLKSVSVPSDTILHKGAFSGSDHAVVTRRN
jgi:hypothetical protein